MVKVKDTHVVDLEGRQVPGRDVREGVQMLKFCLVGHVHITPVIEVFVQPYLLLSPHGARALPAVWSVKVRYKK